MAAMSFLRENGNLSQTPLAAILLEVWNLRLSGALTVDQGGGASRIYFRDGVPVGAQVFAGFRPLGQFLLAQGIIDIDVLDRCLATMAREKRPQGEILVEMGAIDRDTLDRALTEQQSGYLTLVAALQEGGYRFEEAEPVPEWTRGIRIQPLRAILDALAAPQAAPLARAALAQAGGALALGAGYADLAGSFGWTDAEQDLVGRLARPASPDAVLAGSALPPERSRAVLAALVLLGLAEPVAEAEAEAVAGAEADAVGPAEASAGAGASTEAGAAEPGAGGGTGEAASAAGPVVDLAAEPVVELRDVARAGEEAAEPAPAAEPVVDLLDIGVVAPAVLEPPVLVPPAPAGAASLPPSAQGPAPVEAVVPAPAPPARRPVPGVVPAPSPAPAARAPAPPAPPGRRSDPEEARARRQRLLARAMQNMGVGPLSAPPTLRPAAPRAGPQGRPGAAPSPGDAALRRALEFVAPRAKEKDLFARLGVPRTAGPEDVKGAYHQIVRQFHPDKYQSAALADLQPALQDLLSAVNEAYATLSDKAKRAAYLARAGGATSKEAAEGARVDAQKGEACLRTRDYGKARLFFEAAIRADARGDYYAGLAATILADPRAPDRARVRELLAEATKDPACDRGFQLAGAVARQEGDEARAEKMFRAALKVNPRNADAAREVKLIEARRRTVAEERAASKK
jgi:curved DNA-binding protein CbpA